MVQTVRVFRDEILSGSLHAAGAALALAGLVLLVVLASFRDSATAIIAVSIYGTTLLLLYLASALYHLIQHVRAKAVLEFLDHAAIYLLIAGTYTPFTLITMRGPTGYTLLAVIWALAITGIALKAVFRDRIAVLEVVLYLGMGWLILFGLQPLAQSLASGGLWLLFGGGLAYTAGILFYAWRRLPYSHTIWHLFVLKGSVLHFCAILFYVLPSVS